MQKRTSALQGASRDLSTQFLREEFESSDDQPCETWQLFKMKVPKSFTDDELSIESKQTELTVAGEKAGSEDDRQFLYRGIAKRSFERKFQLADHVFVKGARLEHGLLHIELYRELPEALKPRSISIETGKLIENQS